VAGSRVSVSRSEMRRASRSVARRRATKVAGARCKPKVHSRRPVIQAISTEFHTRYQGQSQGLLHRNVGYSFTVFPAPIRGAIHKSPHAGGGTGTRQMRYAGALAVTRPVLAPPFSPKSRRGYCRQTSLRRFDSVLGALPRSGPLGGSAGDLP